MMALRGHTLVAQGGHILVALGGQTVMALAGDKPLWGLRSCWQEGTQLWEGTPWWLWRGQTLLVLLAGGDRALAGGPLVALGAEEPSCGCQELCLQLFPGQTPPVSASPAFFPPKSIKISPIQSPPQVLSPAPPSTCPSQC